MKKIIPIIAIVFFASYTHSFSDLDGYWESIDAPSVSTGHHWLDIFFLPSDNNYGWICGMEGQMIRTTDGGENWSLLSSPLTTKHLERVQFIDKSTGFCSGPANNGAPAGIYRSDDGGTSWTNISPMNLNSGQAKSAWACYFVDKNTGLFFGGDCFEDSVYIWRTTNGGLSWNTFQTFSPNDKFCDGWIESAADDARGFAISSSALWETTDGGRTWDTLSITGKPKHQEEFHKIGNTIIIPHSGLSCAGTTANTGGVIVSRDGGLTWETHVFNQHVYGTWMLSENEAWAAGDNGTLKYTSDAGRTWHDKDCGTVGNDLDDVFFMGPDFGWTVGRNAVYRFVEGYRKVEPENITFPTTCLGETAYDTVWVGNYSFLEINMDMRLLTADVGDIELIFPNRSNFDIPTCRGVPIVFEYSPNTTNPTEEIWQFTLGTDPDTETYTITVRGNPISATARPEEYYITDTVYCNTKGTTSLRWSSETNLEYIYAVTKEEGQPDINFATSLAFPIKRDSDNTTYFESSPIDTGWYDATFSLYTNPCDNRNRIDVEIFGISSIITAPDTIELNAECFDTMLDSVTISNTGNYELKIEDVLIEQDSDLIELLNFEGETGTSVTIEPGRSKEFYYRYLNGNDGNYDAVLSFINNDSTKARGDKNPYRIRLNAYRDKTNLTSSVDSIHFGDICRGQRYYERLLVGNIGKKDATISEPQSESGNFEFDAGNFNFPFTLSEGLSKEITIYLTPDRNGFLIDTVRILSEPCGEGKDIIVTANVVSPRLTFDPVEINEEFQVYDQITIPVNIINTGLTDLTLISASLSPADPDINVDFSPNFPIDLGYLNSDDLDLQVQISGERGKRYVGSLNIEAAGNCPLDTSIAVDLTIIDKAMSFPDSVDFGLITCTPGIYKKNITARNGSLNPDTITSVRIEPGGTPFNINPKATPIYMNSQSEMEFEISFNAQDEGTYEADLIIETIGDMGQTITVNLKAAYGNTLTTPEYSEFSASSVDSCLGIKKYTVTYFNAGTLPDTLDIDFTSEFGNVSTRPEGYQIVPPAGEADVDVFIDYGMYTDPGFQSEVITLTGRTCDRQHTIRIQGLVTEPDIEFDRNTLSFNKWKNYREEKTVTLKNNSTAPLEVYEMNLSAPAGRYEISPVPPFELTPGEEKEISITYLAAEEGIFTDTLAVAARLNCLAFDTLFINSETPPEEYYPVLSLDKKEIKIDSTEYLTLSLAGEVPYLRTDSIEFRFSFRPDIAEPLNVYFNKGNEPFEEVSFSHSAGVITGVVSGDFISDLFTGPNDIMKIRFRGLAAFRDTATVFIEKFDPVPEKPFFPEYRHGMLKIVDFCRPEVVLGQIVMTPDYTVKSIYSDSDELALNLHIEPGEVEFRSTLLNLYGIEVLQTSKTLSSGDAELIIDISEVSSGAYMLRLDTPPGRTEILKVILVK